MIIFLAIFAALGILVVFIYGLKKFFQSEEPPISPTLIYMPSSYNPKPHWSSNLIPPSRVFPHSRPGVPFKKKIDDDNTSSSSTDSAIIGLGIAAVAEDIFSSSSSDVTPDADNGSFSSGGADSGGGGGSSGDW